MKKNIDQVKPIANKLEDEPQHTPIDIREAYAKIYPCNTTVKGVGGPEKSKLGRDASPVQPEECANGAKNNRRNTKPKNAAGLPDESQGSRDTSTSAPKQSAKTIQKPAESNTDKGATGSNRELSRGKNSKGYSSATVENAGIVADVSVRPDSARQTREGSTMLRRESKEENMKRSTSLSAAGIATPQKVQPTAGPWTVGDDHPSVCRIAADGQSSDQICAMDLSPFGLVEAQANARLIAAAPELLAALKALYKHCAMIHKHWGDGCNQKQADAAIAAGHAAIKKAKGQP